MHHDSTVVLMRIVKRGCLFSWSLDIVHIDIKTVSVRYDQTRCDVVFFHLFCVSTHWANVLMQHRVLKSSTEVRSHEFNIREISILFTESSCITIVLILILNLSKGICEWGSYTWLSFTHVWIWWGRSSNFFFSLFILWIVFVRVFKLCNCLNWYMRN